jgi:hypothetical protein
MQSEPFANDSVRNPHANALMTIRALDDEMPRRILGVRYRYEIAGGSAFQASKDFRDHLAGCIVR